MGDQGVVKVPYQEEFIEGYLDVTDQTERQYERVLVDFFEFLGDKDVGIEAVNEQPNDMYINYIDWWIDDAKKRYTDSTVEKNYGLLATYMDYCTMFGHIERNPFDLLSYSDVSTKSRKKIEEGGIIWVSEEEVQKMVQNAPEPRRRNRIIIRLMYSTGLRNTELCGLDVSDVDVEDRKLRVETAKQSNRTVQPVWYPMSLDLPMRNWIEVDRDGLNPGSDALFPSMQSDRISEDMLNQTIKRAAEAAGIQETMYTDEGGGERKKITPHSLRHGFAVRCVREGMDIYTLSQLMRHSSVEVTEQYLKFRNDTLRQEMTRYQPDV